MAERDISLYGVISETQTSIDLGLSTYREIPISLEQDFDLARVIRGLTARDLTVTLSDVGGNPVNPDDDNMLLEIFDSLSLIHI